MLQCWDTGASVAAELSQIQISMIMVHFFSTLQTHFISCHAEPREIDKDAWQTVHSISFLIGS